MKVKDAEMVTEAAKKLGESCADADTTLRQASVEAGETKKLWRSENKSTLIKVGLALIAFPDPTISDVVGGLLVAAGTVQAGMRRRSIYMEDVYKTFNETFREVRSMKEHV